MDSLARYVLWGSAGHAKVLADVISLKGGRVVALIDNNPAASACLRDVPIFIGTAGFDVWLASLPFPITVQAVIAIGGARGADRQALAKILRAAGLTLPSLVHPSAIVSSSARIGDGSHVLAGTVIAADVTLGELCIVNNSANIDHECHLGAGVHVAPGAVLCGCVEVEDNAMIGAGAVVLPRIRIGTGAVIGAGAVVTRNVKPGVVVTGNPARPHPPSLGM